METYDIAVVGGGASGLMAAAKAASVPGLRVILLEGNPKPGKKLLATGNGRCNLSNLNITAEHYHGDSGLIGKQLAEFGFDKIKAEFENMGMELSLDPEGRAYPMSNQAASVLKLLMDLCRERGVDCLTDFTVFSAIATEKGFQVKSVNGRELLAKRLILATGSMASPKHGKTTKQGLSDGYQVAHQLGHSVKPLYPALTRLMVGEKWLKPLGGMRAKVEASLIADGQTIKRERGELIFGDKSVSGICIFNLSVYAGEFFCFGTVENKPCKKLELVLDLCPELSGDELELCLERLKLNRPAMLSGDILMGLMNNKLGLETVRSMGVDTMAPLSSLSTEKLKKLAARVKGLKLSLLGTGGFEDSQISAGGIPLSEVELNTMESTCCPGLYLIGEMLNIHGDCGGYNLHWAWLTALKAGEAAADRRIVL